MGLLVLARALLAAIDRLLALPAAGCRLPAAGGYRAAPCAITSPEVTY
jgi:hypothetical protein